MAELARALGHEMNNTLGAMTLQLELLTQDLPASGAERESLSVLTAAAQQGIGLVRRVRDLARLSRPLLPRPVDLGTVVEGALTALRERLQRLPGVEIAVEAAAAAPVLGDTNELALAVRELVANAVDAVGGTGHVRILTNSAGERVSCRVEDDGGGVRADVRAHVFEPFVSTHAERGRGLGLTIALAVAARHDGDIELSAAGGRGTVATLRLPRAR